MSDAGAVRRNPWRLAPPVAVSILLLAPLALSPPSYRADPGSDADWGWPLVAEGDEPHYLVQVNSVVRDGDLDLKNNYDAAEQGDHQAGRARAGRPLLRHVVYWIDGAHALYWDVFFRIRSPETRQYVVHRRPTAPSDIGDRPQYGLHPPGVALMLAAVLGPLGRPEWLESGALIVSGCMVVLAMWIFRSLLRELGCRGAALEAATAIVFLTTPIWHYARVLYSESFTLALVLAAFTMRLWRTDRPLTGALAPGALLALAILVRPASALFALPLAIDALLRRRASDLVLFVSSPTLAVAALLALNDAMFGSPWRTAQPLHLGDFWNGLTGILLSARSGLLLYAPALLLALAAWPGFLRAQRRPALLALGMVVPSLLLVASWLWWHGGHTYGPRLIVPLIPFIFLPMARVGSMPALRRRPVQLTAGALVLLGLAINWQGAFEHRDHLARHPLREEIRWLKAAAAPETRQRATMPR